MQLTRWTWERGGAAEAARPLVAWMGWKMEEALRRNDFKPCWHTCRTAWPLIWKLLEEVAELLWECVRPYLFRRAGCRRDRVVAEAADVAVVAMMLADWFNGASADRGRDDVW